MSRNHYAEQFRGGYFPQEHWDESTRVNGHELAPPEAVKRRNGVAKGAQAQANPGMVGKNDYKRRGKR